MRLTLATQITVSRMFFGLLSILFLYTIFPFHGWVSFLFFAIAIATDFADGRVARARGEVSTLGIFLDPLIDKLTVLSFLIALIDLKIAPFWMVILILFRELIVTSYRDYAGTKGIPIPSVMSGKIKSTLQYAAILFAIACIGFDGDYSGPANLMFKLSQFTLLFSVIMGYYGMWEIFRNTWGKVTTAS